MAPDDGRGIRLRKKVRAPRGEQDEDRARLIRLLAQQIRTYGAAIGGQGLLSAFHFGLSALLIRSLDPSDYGVFALAIVVASFGAGLSNAATAMPLSVYTPGIGRRVPRVAFEVVLTSVNTLLTMGVFVVTLGSAALLLESFPCAVSFAALTAAWMLRHYSRSFAFTRRRPDVALRGDLGYVATGLLLVSAGWLWLEDLGLLTVVLAALSLAYLGAALFGFEALGVRLRLRFRWRFLRRYGPVWKQVVRWSLVGVIATTLQAQAHAVLVAALAGPAAYAPLAAGQVVFAPVRVTVLAWQMAMRPELAVAMARNDIGRVVQTALASIVVLGSGAAILGPAAAAFWDDLEQALYAAKYAGHPMGFIVALWAVITLLYALRTGPVEVLLALKESRILAVAAIIGAVLSLGLVAGILMVSSPATSLVGVLVGEAFVFAFLSSCAVRRIRRS